EKAALAYQENLLQGEIASVELKRGVCDKDEHLRFEADLTGMGKLKASFQKEGVVTPGTASGVVDGACSVIVASEEAVNNHGLSPIAEIVDGHVVGVDPKIMGIGPVPAIQILLEKNNLSLDKIDSFEINEAFAAQVMACAQDLKIDEEKLNRWGGAVAVGHPLAATGARISLTLARQLANYKLGYGIASACIGGGQGISLLLKRV
ncbi:MAG: thiolase family protein, partial [Bacteriovoracaceae bacterium]